MPSMLTLSGLCNSLTLCYACAVFALCCICTVLYLYLTVFGLCCIWTVFALHCICNPLYVHSAVFALCCIWTLLRSTVFGLCWTRQFKVGAEGNYMCAAPRLWQLEICSTFTFKIIFTSPFIFSIFSLKEGGPAKNQLFNLPPCSSMKTKCWCKFASTASAIQVDLWPLCLSTTRADPKFWRSNTSTQICDETTSWSNGKLN